VTLALPEELRRHLMTPTLAPLWSSLRARLEANGHAVRGTIDVDLDDDGADRLSGLLGRVVPPGRTRLKLADLDAALRSSAAARGVVAVVASLTGSELRDRPAERTAQRHEWDRVWSELDDELARAGLASMPWVTEWVEWLHRGGLLTRLRPEGAAVVAGRAVRTLALVLSSPAERALGELASGERALGELAFAVTGSAHGLDENTPTAALVLRATAMALGVALPVSVTDRRLLWQRLGVSTDSISGTVIVWGLRPPGNDRWSAMMRDRADLDLVTHLTVRELRSHDVALAPAGTVGFACENPQVLQAAAAAGVSAPVICLSGNPASAGLMLLSRLAVRYHGDFDWPGVAIARRLFSVGAEPWRMGAADYLAAVAGIESQVGLPLTGNSEPTPWDEDLGATMRRTNVAVHEEALLDLLLGDLTSVRSPATSHPHR
jgi:uncharacterized protein (TIGR02679 family)